jgi:two-component system OmpR family sensor kinase
MTTPSRRSQGRPSLARLSLRTRLLAGLIAVTAAFLLIMGGVSTMVMSRHLNEQSNADLLAAVGLPTGQLEGSPDYAIATATSAARGTTSGIGIGTGTATGTIQGVPNGSKSMARLVTGLRQLAYANLNLNADMHTTFTVTDPSGSPVLLAAARHLKHGQILVIAQVGNEAASEMRSLIIAELATGGLLIALLAAGGRWLIARGLSPLDHMATTANQITARGSLTARMPDSGDRGEVANLASAINTMLDRIQHAFGARLRSEQKVRQFAADASHELRTPLTTISGYAELYRQGALDAERLPNAMRRIEQEAQRMSRLVAELLELARLDRTSSLDLTETDLGLLVRDAAADASAVEPGRPIKVEAPGRLVIVADEPRIRQVLANLLANVREHTPEDTPVEIGLGPAYPTAGWLASSGGQGVLLEVADSGPGMTEEDTARAFDRFHRGSHAPEANAAVGPGSGLGLSIVQAIAAAHGGMAVLESAPGYGTRVRVWLPAGFPA